MRCYTHFLRILLFSLLLSSCIIIDFESDSTPERKYKAERLWRREIFGYIAFDSPPLVTGSYCYFYTYDLGKVVKINLETGKVLWESAWINGLYQQPQKIGEYIYQPSTSGTITVLDDANGNRAASIGLAGNTMYYKNYAVASGEYLFWSNYPYTSSETRGLMRLDTTKIDFSEDPYTVQTVIQELVWSDGETGIAVQLLVEDGIVYFINRSGVLIALDAEIGTVLWERATSYDEIKPRFALALHDEKILVITKNMSCYNKLTGEFIFEITELDNADIHFDKLRFTVHNNILYYIVNYGATVTAVNLDTGKILWSKNAYSHCKNNYNYDGYVDCLCSGRHYYRPLAHVYGDALFIMSDSGLRVYNADKGTFIGVDKTLIMDIDYSVLYNDTLVFLGDYPDKTTASGYVTAIRCK